MFRIRMHGRGGQGVVTGAAMLSVAAFLEGKPAQAFSSFGSERMDAPAGDDRQGGNASVVPARRSEVRN